MRKNMGDVLTLSQVSRTWTSLEPDEIAHSLAELLANTLSLHLVYVRLGGASLRCSTEAAAGGNGAPVDLNEARAMVLPHLAEGRVDSEQAVAVPGTEPPLRLTATGCDLGELSVQVVAGSVEADFPTATCRLLLDLAAAQAAVALQAAAEDGPNGKLSAVERSRLEAEEALRRSEARFRGLMEQAPMSVQIFSPEGETLSVNRAWEKLWGFTFEELGSYNVLQDSQLEERGVLEYIRRGFAGETTRVPAIEYNPEVTAPHLRQADDPRRWIAAVIFPLKDAEGVVREVVLVHEDITARKRAQDELRIRLEQLAEADRQKENLLASLRDTDQRKDEFLATLAHELRNPLAPIRNGLQILKLPHVDAQSARRATELMERQVHQLVRLVDDLLDVSRVMRGKVDLRREPVELASVVARAVETAQPLIEARDHRLAVSLPQQSMLLFADPVRLSQVIANLLMNAAKYTDRHGDISLSADLEGDRAVVSVRDNGIGIAPQMIPHVFDLFVQVDHATNRSEGGLGLGLTLVKNLVALHGGSVDLRSEGLGKGSEFIIRLPLMPAQPQETPEPAQSRTGVGRSGLRVLVVDDNVDAATTLGMLLELLGHDVRVTHDGPSALEVAKTFLPALVLLDIGMPEMDGFEVARCLRSMPETRDVVLAALTGWGQDEDRRRTTEAGFDHHLVKPLEPRTLSALLAELAEGSSIL